MATQTVLNNLHCMTMENAELGVIQDAAIAIEEHKIVWVGQNESLPKECQAWPKEDLKQQWVTPGFVDCHTHVIYGGQRAEEFAWRLHGESYAEIHQKGGGIHSTVKATREASEEVLLASAKKRIQQMMRYGTTTLEIKTGYGLDPQNELKMLNVAAKLKKELPVSISPTFLGMHALPKDKQNRDAYIAEMLDTVLPKVAEQKLADAVDVFCEHIAFSVDEAQQLFEAAKALGLEIKIHAEQLSDQGGAVLASQYGAVSADHLEYAGEAAVDAMAKAGTVAVLLPGAFYFLKETQKPPVELLRNAGVKIALATDCNPGSSPAVSLPLIMNMGCVLFDLTPEEALLSVTANSAKALGLDDRGQLKAGLRADLAVWDIDNVYEICYYLGHTQPSQLMIAGEWMA